MKKQGSKTKTAGLATTISPSDNNEFIQFDGTTTPIISTGDTDWVPTGLTEIEEVNEKIDALIEALGVKDKVDEIIKCKRIVEKLEE